MAASGGEEDVLVDQGALPVNSFIRPSHFRRDAYPGPNQYDVGKRAMAKTV
jgi:hypothetical protein